MKKNMLKKTVFILLIIALLCIVWALSVNAYIVHSAKKTTTDSPTGEFDCILVLGAGVRNGHPSPMLQDRLDCAIDLYNKGVAKKLIMSGDHGRTDYDEVNTMKSYAIDYGIPSEDVFMDHAGFSTYESIYRAKEVFLAKRIVIVTQNYHLSRALYVARSLGIEAVGVPSDPRVYAGQTYREIREILARNKDFLYCIFKPEPKYLGPAIAVNGNGDMTND